ncbi:hypothetical protein NIES4071_103600 (plasmid) [Calothrix sp. NIES-4071]|nr:hypothetical protein NIES4071_103600 [Calothrix sp. NIES-4071]BAZ64347.1 hypothetical protein NIES4105_100800 [Calothrix sp. NIES-4105]
MSRVTEGGEFLRIRRASSGIDGIVFAYLGNKVQPQSELACEAMRAYWLPLALKERGIKKKELKSAGQKAIAQLLQQAEMIRLECGLSMEEVPFGYLSVAPRNTAAMPLNSKQSTIEEVELQEIESEDLDEDDDIDDADEGMLQFSALDPGFRISG